MYQKPEKARRAHERLPTNLLLLSPTSSTRPPVVRLFPLHPPRRGTAPGPEAWPLTHRVAAIIVICSAARFACLRPGTPGHYCVCVQPTSLALLRAFTPSPAPLRRLRGPGGALTDRFPIQSPSRITRKPPDRGWSSKQRSSVLPATRESSRGFVAARGAFRDRCRNTKGPTSPATGSPSILVSSPPGHHLHHPYEETPLHETRPSSRAPCLKR